MKSALQLLNQTLWVLGKICSNTFEKNYWQPMLNSQIIEGINPDQVVTIAIISSRDSYLRGSKYPTEPTFDPNGAGHWNNL